MSRALLRRWFCAVLTALALAGAQGTGRPAHAVTIEIDDVASDRVERQRAFAEGALPLPGTPDLGQLADRLAAKGLKAGAPMLVRIFKAESELEVWMMKDGQYVLFATYPICHWAGTVGPKLREGDRQNPEGFYSVGARQLHRIGRWPRSLNIGYPNSFDRAYGRTGSYILVHGGCSSVGCFAMTNAVMSEIFALTEQALRAGQSRVGLHIFPFRMTKANMAAQASSPWAEFWTNLKEGYDAFEETRLPPRVGLCDRRYVIEPQRPGEVGAEGPLALCGVLRAALIEPSSLSLAELPPAWPRNPELSAASQPPPDQSMPLLRSAYSGNPLPPLPTLAEQVMLLPPRSMRPRGVRLASLGAHRPGPPSCNMGLASCRKYLALKSTAEVARPLKGRATVSRPVVSRTVGRELSRALAGLSTAPHPEPPSRRNTR